MQQFSVSFVWQQQQQVARLSLLCIAKVEFLPFSRHFLTLPPVLSLFLTHTLTDSLFHLSQEHIQEVLDKWTQIDDEIWAKVIVFERNRRVAKAYARAPVLTINGSDDGFDGMR